MISTVLGVLVIAIVLSLAIVPPWFLGGVMPEVEIAGAIAACAISLIALIARYCSHRTIPVVDIVTCLLVASIIFGLFQMCPLPKRLASFLSPNAVKLRDELVGTEVEQHGRNSNDHSRRVSAGFSISLFPASTWQTVLLISVCLGVFLSCRFVCNDAFSCRWLLTAIAINGAALAVFGIAQQLSWNGKIYGIVPLPPDGGQPFGPFVNRNHGGGFLNLCLAAAIGHAWFAWRRTTTPHDETSKLTESSKNGGRTNWLLYEVAQLNAEKVLSAAIIVFIAIGITSSLSRGSLLAMVLTAFAVALVIFRRRVVWLGSIVVVSCVGFVALAWLGRINPIQDRLASEGDLNSLSAGRLEHWAGSLNLVPNFWLTGTGLGTYRFVYGMEERQNNDVWFVHAENHFVETLVETGLIGLALLLAILGTVLWRSIRLTFSSRRDAQCFGLAGMFCIISQVVAGCFDFGLYAPANMLLMVVMCGMVFGFQESPTECNPSLKSKANAGLTVLLIVLAAGASAIAAQEFWSKKFSKDVERQMRQLQVDDEPTDDLVNNAMGLLRRAIDIAPHDAILHFKLAEFQILEFRKKATDDIQKHNPKLTDRILAWQLTDPMYLHHTMRSLEQLDDWEQLAQLRASPTIQQKLVPAVESLVVARELCPMIARVHLRLAQFDVAVKDGKSEDIHIARAIRVEPSRANLHYAAGVLKLNSGNVDSCLDAWTNSLSLSHKYVDPIVGLAKQHGLMDQLVSSVIPDDPHLMFQLVRQQFSSKEDLVYRTKLLGRAKQLIEKSKAQSAADVFLLAELYVEAEGDKRAAIHFERAIKMDPEQAHWRESYAASLIRLGRWQQAIEQYRKCQVLTGGDKSYREEINEVHRKRRSDRQ